MKCSEDRSAISTRSRSRSSALAVSERADDRPESTPRLYNILEIARDLASVRVHTRCQPKPDGPWDGWYEWPDPDGGKGRVAFYDTGW